MAPLLQPAAAQASVLGFGSRSGPECLRRIQRRVYRRAERGASQRTWIHWALVGLGSVASFFGEPMNLSLVETEAPRTGIASPPLVGETRAEREAERTWEYSPGQLDAVNRTARLQGSKSRSLPRWTTRDRVRTGSGRSVPPALRPRTDQPRKPHARIRRQPHQGAAA